MLVIDDEPNLRAMLDILFRREAYDVTLAPGFNSGKDAVVNAPHPYGVVLTDLMMPDGSGLEIINAAIARSRETQVIVMTAHSTLDIAKDALWRGAYDFLTKPVDTKELRARVASAFDKSEIVAENRKLRAQIARFEPRDLLGRSESMRKIHELVGRVANARSTVLITGESGTGKERVARAIHQASDRAQRPFRVVNCGAIPEALLESELFGHERGAFTGASARTMGIFREADGGTVLLDEVGELPLQMQVQLLRVLQERRVRGVGETQETTIDVRMLAATNRDIEEEVRQGRFRQDLYYRLNVIRVPMPPLRDRREDISDLAHYFLARCAEEHGKDIRSLSPDALRALQAYNFPGTVRELENFIERAVALATSVQLGLGDLPSELSGDLAKAMPSLVSLPVEGCSLDEVMNEVERRLILEALERAGGVRTNAAKLLNISFRSLRYRLQKLAMDSGDDEIPSGERRWIKD